MRFRSGIFRDCKRREGTGFPAKDTSSRQPRRPQVNTGPRGTEPTLPGAGGESVGAQGACQLSVGRWDLGKQAASPRASPQIGPLVPGRRPRRRRTDEDAGAGHTGERRGVYVGSALCTVKVNT